MSRMARRPPGRRGSSWQTANANESSAESSEAPPAFGQLCFRWRAFEQRRPGVFAMPTQDPLVFLQTLLTKEFGTHPHLSLIHI